MCTCVYDIFDASHLSFCSLGFSWCILSTRMRRSTRDRYDITPSHRYPIADKPVWLERAVKRVTFILKMPDMFKWSLNKSVKFCSSSSATDPAPVVWEWLNSNLAAWRHHSRPFFPSFWLQESYVWKMYQERCWDFFPAGDCFRKQYEDQLG